VFSRRLRGKEVFANKTPSHTVNHDEYLANPIYADRCGASLGNDQDSSNHVSIKMRGVLA
jgi:hypothetical protein